MGYFLYKGLKKPLIFFGLKDKYIYYAMGSAVGGFVIVGILSSLFGSLGMFMGFGIAGAGVFASFKMQDKNGLYSKTKNEEELHMMSTKFKNNKLLQKKTKNKTRE